MANISDRRITVPLPNFHRLSMDKRLPLHGQRKCTWEYFCKVNTKFLVTESPMFWPKTIGEIDRSFFDSVLDMTEDEDAVGGKEKWYSETIY